MLVVVELCSYGVDRKQSRREIPIVKGEEGWKRGIKEG
jgi:hypothetical protein